MVFFFASYYRLTFLFAIPHFSRITLSIIYSFFGKNLMAQLHKLKADKLGSVRSRSVLLTVGAITLYSYSVTQVQFNIDSIDCILGLTRILPASFWLALILLTSAFAILCFSSEGNNYLFFLQWSLLIVALWLTPFIIGGISVSQPCIAVAFSHFGTTEYIVRTGHSTPDMSFYLNWPGGMILGAVLTEILGINRPDLMLALTPFVLQFLYLFPLFLFLRNSLGEDKINHCWGAIWVFSLANWLLQNYYSSQAIAFVYFIFLLAILSKIAFWKENRNVLIYPLSLILILSCLTFTHLLTAIVSLTIVLGFRVINRIRTYALLMIGAVLIASWTMYITANFFEWRLPYVLENAFGITSLFQSVSVIGHTGSNAYQIGSLLRTLSVIYFLIIGFIGIILGLKSKKKIHTDLTILIILISSGIVTITLALGYGGEILVRFYLFSLPAIPYFGTKLLNNKTGRPVFLVILLVALPLHFTSHYNRQAGYITPSHVAALHFFPNHMTQGLIINDVKTELWKNQEKYTYVRLPAD